MVKPDLDGMELDDRLVDGLPMLKVANELLPLPGVEKQALDCRCKPPLTELDDDRNPFALFEYPGFGAGRLGGGSSSSLKVRSMTSDLRLDPAPPFD